nr:helix-turn-helix domain-containing protein [uncultured Schaedlerella sp.]
MDMKQKELGSYGDFRKYSVEEISLMLGIGKTKTREMLQSRLLPVTKIGRDYFTSKTAIQEFLSDNVGKELFF